VSGIGDHHNQIDLIYEDDAVHRSSTALFGFKDPAVIDELAKLAAHVIGPKSAHPAVFTTR